MIIGINGYIGSGKDTVGAIIQKLTEPDIENYVTIKAGQMIPAKGVSSWQIKKFAAKLKQMASLMLGVPVEQFESQEFKKTFLSDEWSFYWTVREEPRMTVREFLQRLGTEAVRHGLHDNAWVNALFSDYKCLCNNCRPEDCDRMPNWIITDMRFPNEMKAVTDRQGITIRVNRQLAEAPYQTLEQRHPSETSLDKERFDHIIENNGTIEELTERVRQILEYSGILKQQEAA